MIESIFPLIFVIIVFVLGILAKRILYVDEHEASILNELNTFDDNFQAMENLDKESDYKLGSNHLYQ
jgi:hypothetical protein